nr:P3 [Euphorbia ringspot virus]
GRAGSQEEHNKESTMNLLIKCVYKPRLMHDLLMEEPYLIILSVCSPSLLIAMHRSGSLGRAIEQFIHTDTKLATALTIMEQLSHRVSASKAIEKQLEIISSKSEELLSVILSSRQLTLSATIAVQTLSNMSEERKVNQQLISNGYSVVNRLLADFDERSIQKKLACSWAELSALEKLSLTKDSLKVWHSSRKFSEENMHRDIEKTCRSSCIEFLDRCKNKVYNKYSKTKERITNHMHIRVGRFVCYLINSTSKVLPDLLRLVNTLLAMNLILNCYKIINGIIIQNREAKLAQAQLIAMKEGKETVCLYEMYYDQFKVMPTLDEFIDFVEKIDHDKAQRISDSLRQKVEVNHQ